MRTPVWTRSTAKLSAICTIVPWYQTTKKHIGCQLERSERPMYLLDQPHRSFASPGLSWTSPRDAIGIAAVLASRKTREKGGALVLDCV